jgi:hypothetical protein
MNNYKLARDETSKYVCCKPSAVAISGCIAMKEAGNAIARAIGNDSIAFAMNPVARLFVKTLCTKTYQSIQEMN